MRLRLRGGILGVAAFAAPLAAQSPPPLDKTELIRLLTNPLFAQTEVADVVRRSCLTFRPTREPARINSRSAAAVARRFPASRPCCTPFGPPNRAASVSHQTTWRSAAETPAPPSWPW